MSKKVQNKCEKIMIIENNMIRNLPMCQRNINNSKPTLISETNFKQIQDLSMFKSNIKKEILKNQNSLMIAKEENKQVQLKDIIQELEQKQEPENIKKDDNEEKVRIIRRSEELRKEQDEIMRRCNSLILSVKCKAIQDTQKLEKNNTEYELKQREKTLQNIMDKEREKEIQAFLRNKERECVKKHEYAKCILKQIDDHEKLKNKQIEKIQKESKLLKFKAQQRSIKDEENNKKNYNLQKFVKEQNQKLNEQIKRERELKDKAEKIENVKIQELIRKKLRDEKEMELRHKKEKQLQERELARLWKLQKGTKILSDLKEEIMNERIQEKKEWRERELQVVCNNKFEEETTKKIRENQVEDKRKMIEVDLEERRKEAEEQTKQTEELKNELMTQLLKRKQVMDNYGSELQSQITKKQEEKRMYKENELKEQRILNEKLQQRENELRKTIQNKIIEMKKFNIPESCIQHLTRKQESLLK